MESYHKFKSFETEEIPQEMIDAALELFKVIQKNGGFFIAATIIGEDLASNIMVKGISPEIVKQAILQLSSQLDTYIPEPSATKH